MPRAPGDAYKLKDENEAGDRWTKERTRAVSQVRASQAQRQGVRTPSGMGAAQGAVRRPAAPPPDP